MGLRDVTESLRVATSGVRGATSTGLLKPQNPLVAARIAKDLRKWGTNPALGYSVGEARSPEDLAIIDVDDQLHPEVSFAEIEHRIDALAKGLLDRGINSSDTVAIMARNSRAMAEVIVAVSRIGADLVYLNTGASADQISTVLRNERVDLVVRDSEFAHLCPPGLPWLGTDDPAGVSLLDSLPTRGKLAKPDRVGQHIILTSATSGAVPRGTARASLHVDALAAILDTFPIKLDDTYLIAAPLFHAWGWMNHRIACSLGATEMFVRRSDPERLLALIASHEVEVFVTVPTVLAKIMALPPTVRDQHDTSSLRCVAVSGSELPGELAWDFMDHFGDVLFNLYGTTEAAFASVATPADLRDDPNTAGSPLPGVRVEILDRRGRPVQRGEVGRVYALSRTSFDGYTDGTDRDRVRGMVFTGDLGRLDEKGRLSLAGRADDVIVTGGEKVHPVEVESVLLSHPAVADAAVVGVEDNVYGAVVQAYLVLEPDAAPDDYEEAATMAALREYTRTRLGPRHRPRDMFVVDTLPRTETGKLRRRALVDPEAADDPEWT
ncbi:MAG: AMP-binding protein [Candidatus Nanopelagicales bacterium]